MLRGQRNDYFTLFDFSAKQDPVRACWSRTTPPTSRDSWADDGFEKRLIKPGITVSRRSRGADEAKYIHGHFGKGTFTFYGGHDPRYQHAVGIRRPTSPSTRIRRVTASY